MKIRHKSAFFAYPAAPKDLIGPIQNAAEVVEKANNINLKCWPQLDVFGNHIPDEVRDGIMHSDVLVCDITRPNLNVYYEAGYAIGRGKPIAPVLNASFAEAVIDIRKDGFFDNIGYEAYENSSELAGILQDLPGSVLINLYSKPINIQQPLFLLDTFRKTDFRNAIVSAVKGSKTFYRSFDPVEVPRFSTISMIAEVSSSSGIIIPFLEQHIDDSERHNLRAAFIAGLSHGLGRNTLLLKFGTSNSQLPADYRDFILSIHHEADLNNIINDFSKNAFIASQTISSSLVRREKTALQKLTLGSSAAENEFRNLELYFVETAEFIRTLRGEISVVAGRKGSGKTAIFFRVRDVLRTQKHNSITDLKPESHQLSLFREELLKIVDAGVFDHTLAAFWYFVILSEVLLTIKRQADFQAKYDYKALSIATEIEQLLQRYSINNSGDFTSRINHLGNFILQEVDRINSRGQTLSPELLTNIIFRGGITDIKATILKHSTSRSRMVLLFDNIDKGWPTNGVNAFDIRLVRLLIESLDKVRRDFNVQDRDFTSVVFLRNDIYELLVEETPDRGKAGQVRIDWTDRAKLRQVIYKRLQASSEEKHTGFEQLWGKYFVSDVNERDLFEYFVDHCLMRPRFLINIIENAVANAINRGHERVSQEDSIDAVRQHSLYLVNDFGYEIRDVSGLSADILYSLVGATKLLTKDEVLERFKEVGIENAELETAFHLMLWYGVIGIALKDGSERFIYDYEYNMKRLEAETRVLGTDILYVTNSALHVALRN